MISQPRSEASSTEDRSKLANAMAFKCHVPSNHLGGDIDPKNNGKLPHRGRTRCSSDSFCRVLVTAGASGQRCTRIKAMKTHQERGEREGEEESGRLTAYSPLRTSPARKDKCSRLAIYLNSLLRR